MKRKELYSIKENSGYFDKENRKLINKNLSLLNDKLDLNNLMQQLEENDRYNNQANCLTKRQFVCLQNFKNDLKEKKIQAAYHELVDFIFNYNDMDEAEITLFEKIILKDCIDNFKEIM